MKPTKTYSCRVCGGDIVFRFRKRNPNLKPPSGGMSAIARKQCREGNPNPIRRKPIPIHLSGGCQLQLPLN